MMSVLPVSGICFVMSVLPVWELLRDVCFAGVWDLLRDVCFAGVCGVWVSVWWMINGVYVGRGCAGTHRFMLCCKGAVP